MNNPCCNTETAPASAETETRPVRRPRYQVEHSPEAHTVRVELPGVSKDAVRLNLDDGVLHLTAPRRSTVPANWKPLHRELSEAGYELRLKLNDRVDESRLSAGLEDGVLTLVLPVKETVKPRSISLQ